MIAATGMALRAAHNVKFRIQRIALWTSRTRAVVDPHCSAHRRGLLRSQRNGRASSADVGPGQRGFWRSGPVMDRDFKVLNGYFRLVVRHERLPRSGSAERVS